MDVGRALAKAEELSRLLEENRALWQSNSHQERLIHDVQIRQLLPVVIRIGKTIDEVLTMRIAMEPAHGWTWSQAYKFLPSLIGLLQQKEELDEILGPQGPNLAAESFHPWVWDSVKSLWADGHHRQAVETAATVIDDHLKAKVARYDLNGVKLVQQAFSLNPPERDKPRLRFPNVRPDTDEWNNRHQGALDFGAGCFRAIRNIVSHSSQQPSEAVALEALAALSLLTRWIDEAEVTTS